MQENALQERISTNIMAAHKIFNDPVYGFVTIPRGLLMDLVEHPWFQRLRRIRQLGMTDFVYPGALHTRFQHALGALHLMQSAVEVLRTKGVEITDEESEAVQVAILLHDIGHGPFSHVLEHSLLPFHHEEISLAIMDTLNKEMGGKLSLAIRIFKGTYEKPFLQQLVSGQLDMDRMDYLNRDSFFTGVHEGVIGYDRIIKMLQVVDGRLVVEEKGVYSIEKFLIARRLMYWQVYLHKTVLVAEKMLVMFLHRLAALNRSKTLAITSPLLSQIFAFPEKKFDSPHEILPIFTMLDDHDILQEIKAHRNSPDFILKLLAEGLLDRKLFKVILDRNPPIPEDLELLKDQIAAKYGALTPDWASLLISGTEASRAYLSGKDEILILKKNGLLVPYSEETDAPITEKMTEKYYTIYPV